MTQLWPRLPFVVAESIYADLSASGKSPTPATAHADQIWAPVGGQVDVRTIAELSKSLTHVAGQFGYPDQAAPDVRIAFDRAAAPVLRQYMDLSWTEAGARDLWSFISLAVLPHLTIWRFGTENRERWVASDLTRHTWSRLWWQAVTFEGHQDLLSRLTESDLNQLLERRTIGGDPRLVVSIAQAILEAPSGVPRRQLIRDVGLRLLRYLAFLDVRSLDDASLDALCRTLTDESCQRIVQPQQSSTEIASPAEAPKAWWRSRRSSLPGRHRNL